MLKVAKDCGEGQVLERSKEALICRFFHDKLD